MSGHDYGKLAAPQSRHSRPQSRAVIGPLRAVHPERRTWLFGFSVSSWSNCGPIAQERAHERSSARPNTGRCQDRLASVSADDPGQRRRPRRLGRMRGRERRSSPLHVLPAQASGDGSDVADPGSHRRPRRARGRARTRSDSREADPRLGAAGTRVRPGPSRSASASSSPNPTQRPRRLP
jgi:hypothetical protein